MASRPEEDLKCPICHDVFTHPVILSCSHSFCRACWQRWWTERSNHKCPVCNTTSQQYDPPCNLALKNLCEAFPPEKYSAVLCSLHSEELKLFCEDHRTPVCVICLHSSSHNNHSFRPINEVALDYREGLRTLLEPLKETLDLFKDMKLHLDQTNKDIEDQAKDAETQINKEFSMLQELLKKEQKARTDAVMQEKKLKSLVLKGKIKDLSRDIEALSDKVRATEEVLKAENISFLQNYNTAADGVDGFQLKDPQPIKDGLIDTSKHLDNLPLQVLDSMKKAITHSRSGPPPGPPPGSPPGPPPGSPLPTGRSRRLLGASPCGGGLTSRTGPHLVDELQMWHTYTAYIRHCVAPLARTPATPPP